MTVLITGVSGFIGGDLFAFLKNETTHQPIGIARTTNNDQQQYFNVDLVDATSVNNFINVALQQHIVIDAVVHCAAVLADATNNTNFALFEQNNTLTKHLIQIVQQLGIKTLINLSTIGVYPNKDGEYSETTMVQPSKNFECLYGLSKFCSEELFNFLLLPSQTNIVNLRLSQVYGDRMRTDRIYKQMEHEMKTTQKITVWANGERVSNFVPIAYVLKVIHYFLSNPVTDTFNVGQQNFTYKQLAELVIANNNAKNVDICLVNKGVASKVYINTSKLNSLVQ